MIHIRAVSPTDVTPRLVESLGANDGVLNLVVLEGVARNPDGDSLQFDVAEVMAPPFPMVEFDQPVETAFAELQGSPAVVVTKAGEALGVLTRSDLLEFLAHRRGSRG